MKEFDINNKITLANHPYIYFVGVGGIGMSALARWFKANSFKVAGYDKTSTDLTDELVKENILVCFNDAIDCIPYEYNQSETLVIYTPAIPSESRILKHFKSLGNIIIKRADALQIITNNTYTIAVAGTHGKTTTSSMIAHVLKYSDLNISAFLGGITQNYSTNILIGNDTVSKPITVVEADEYDKSFLKLNPNIAVVTTTDPDHLDIYSDKSEFENTFIQFASNTPPSGTVVYHCDTVIETTKLVCNQISYGIKGRYKAENLKIENQQFKFEILDTQSNEQIPISLIIPGLHNIMNALATFAVAKVIGLSNVQIQAGLASFKGVKRRFEYLVKSEKVVYIDDYAHHPKELNAFISTVKTLYPNKKFTLIFQPHLYTRTRDFMKDFAVELSKVDELILLDIYPARELPLEGISSDELIKLVDCGKKNVVSKAELLNFLNENPLEIVATAGAGDVDKFVPLIEKMLIKKYEIYR